MSEEWRKIDQCPGYLISSLGRVLSVRRKTPKLLKIALDKNGYPYCSFWTEENPNKKIKIHRLIALAFIPNPLNLPMVNHINAIKTDNSIDNLEWVTAKENHQHAANLGRWCGRRGSGKIYTWKHSEHGTFTGTAQELAKLYGGKHYNYTGLFRGDSKIHRGWQAVVTTSPKY